MSKENGPGAPRVLAEPVDSLSSATASLTDLTLNAEVHRICVVEGGYPGDWPRHERCPCCGTGKLRFLFHKQGIAHEQCVNCDFVCINPYPPDEILKKIYSGSYYTNFREYYEARHLRESGGHSVTAAPIEMLETMIERASGERQTGEWLDVGGGVGTVADLIRQRRPGWRITLNEYNPRSIELAREIYGLEPVSHDASRLATAGCRFDVISAIMVLEHIPDPLDFVRSYARLLNPGGILVAMVPHFTHLNAAVSKAASPNVTPPFHVSLFRCSNLRLLLERSGLFEQVHIEQTGPAAFSLLHHYPYGEYWDVTIPTAENPMPRSIKIQEYSPEMNAGLNALGEAESKIGDYFAKSDGRLYLTSFSRRAQ